MTITLPIPHKVLFPNGGHGHHLAVSRQRKLHRQLAFFSALRVLGVRNTPTRILLRDRRIFGISHKGKLTNADYRKISTLLLPASPPTFSTYSLTFHFPTNRNRDDDNYSAACKSYRDGIADALRMDDHGLRISGAPSLLHDSTLTTPFLTFTLHP
jgi:hypothetical protein